MAEHELHHQVLAWDLAHREHRRLDAAALMTGDFRAISMQALSAPAYLDLHFNGADLNIDRHDTVFSQVSVHGPVALATGSQHIAGQRSGRGIDQVQLISQVWRHDGERWRIALVHASAPSPPGPAGSAQSVEAPSTGPRPPGTPWVSPYLTVSDGDTAMAWYHRVFDFSPGFVRRGAEERVEHAELSYRDQKILIAPVGSPGGGEATPRQLGRSSPVSMFVYVPDCDVVVERARAAGATVLIEATTMFWGDRIGKIADPDGHLWVIATHLEDLSEQQMTGRARS